MVQQEDQIRMLNASLDTGHIHSRHLTLLGESEQNLKEVLDQPVAAQLLVNTIHHSYGNELVSVYLFDDGHKELLLYAIAGNNRSFPPASYRQKADRGLIARAVQTRNTIIANNTQSEADFSQLENQSFNSELIIPLIQNGLLKGILVVDDGKVEAFNNYDVAALEIATKKLVNSWERTGNQQRLTDLIRSGIELTSKLDTQSIVEQIAAIAKQTLAAKFVFVILLDQEGRFTNTAWVGNAPLLLRSLKKNLGKDGLIKETMNSHQVLRIRDIRNFDLTAPLKTDHAEFTNMLAFPLRLHQLSIGAILAFGKQDQSSFSDDDKSLANLLANQASAAIERAWLYQELHSTLLTTTSLYQLSIRILEANDLPQAAEAIAETAFNLGQASLTGIVLFNAELEILTQAEVDKKGIRPKVSYPTHIVKLTMQTGQTTILSDEDSTYKICVPLQTPQKLYGALWVNLPDGQMYNSRYAADLQTLTNQATVALERSILLTQTSTQTRQLEAAYEELETTYDQTLVALTSALDARDRETEGHSLRVREIASRLGRELGLTSKQLKALERGALLHDIGKIGVGDNILLKPGPLSEEDWETMHQHPEIGAHIIERVPFLSDTISVVRYHHERWDGSGYPIRLAGTEIPLLARIFAIVDTYDALISDRPYRKKKSEAEAAQILSEHAGKLFDPEIVAVFIDLLKNGHFNDILRN